MVMIQKIIASQGDIEAVAAKSPQGLTLLMEHVSSNRAYKFDFLIHIIY